MLTRSETELDTVIVATPLRGGCCSKPYSFTDGVEIREIKSILWELAVAGKLLSEDDREYLNSSQYWLSVTERIENWSFGQSDDQLYERARHAMFALQILCPSGGRNLYLKLHDTPSGLDNVGSMHPARMHSTSIGRLTVLEHQGLQPDFDKVYRGVRRSFSEGIVRLQNPIVLLEQGLQAGHVYLSTLMWVMGLDMLLMAGEKVPFVERAIGFLGRDTQVFPAVLQSNRQPKLEVAEIVDDIYELRNLVAHGREIPFKPFRQSHDIVDSTEAPLTYESTYAQVIMESALFLLVKSLRKIMVEGLVDVVKDEANWKRRLKTSAKLERQRAVTRPGE